MIYFGGPNLFHLRQRWHCGCLRLQQLDSTVKTNDAIAHNWQGAKFFCLLKFRGSNGDFFLEHELPLKTLSRGYDYICLAATEVFTSQHSHKFFRYLVKQLSFNLCSL